MLHNSKVTVVHESVCIDHSMTVNQDIDDHVCMCVCLIVQFANCRIPEFRRKLGYDKNNMDNPEARKMFIGKCESFQPIPMHIDNTSHCHMMHEQVYAALCECFPPEVMFVRKEFLCEATKLEMKKLRVCKHTRSVLYDRFRKSPIRACFGLWCGKLWYAKWNKVWGFSTRV